jgi:hypothetical protein
MKMKFAELKFYVQERILKDFIKSEEYKQVVEKMNKEFELDMIKIESKGIFNDNSFNVVIHDDVLNFLNKIYNENIPNDIFYAVKYNLIGYICIQNDAEEPIKIQITNVTAKFLYEVVDKLKNDLNKWFINVKENIARQVNLEEDFNDSEEGCYNYLIRTDFEFTKEGKRI